MGLGEMVKLRLSSSVREKQKRIQEADKLLSSILDKNFLDEKKVAAAEQVAKEISGEELISMIETEDFVSSIDIDIFTIYCSKTGQPIGRRSEQQISMLLSIHGKEKAEELLPFIGSNNIAAHWMRTDSESLTKLAKIDPYGYFVFAASRAMQYKAEGWNASEQKWKSAEYMQKWNLEKIKLYQIISKHPVETIIYVNSAWKEYLSFINPTKVRRVIQFPYEKLSDIGRLKNIRAIASSLRDVVKSAVRSVVVSRAHFTYSDAQDALDKLGGHTQFRKQNRLSFMEDTEIAYQELKSLLGSYKHQRIAKSYTGVREEKPKLPPFKPAIPAPTPGEKVTFKFAAPIKKESKALNLKLKLGKKG